MRRRRARFALVVIALACVLAAAPAVAAPDREGATAPAAERPEADGVRDAVDALWDWLRKLVVGDDTTKSDQMPGSGLDPDGHKPNHA